MNQEAMFSAWQEFLGERQLDKVLELADKYPDKRSLVVSFSDLERFNAELAEDLLTRPRYVLDIANEALLKLDLPIDVSLDRAEVRVVSVPNRIKARKLRDDHVGRLVAIDGMVRMASKAFTAITSLSVQCLRCGTEFFVAPKKPEGGITCPDVTCDRPGPFKKNLDKSIKTTKRIIQLQENPEELRGGELPETISVILTGDLVEGIMPGNRVVVNGIVKMAEIKSKGETLDFEHYIDAVSVEIIEREFEEITITPEDEAMILQIAGSEDVLSAIKTSIAPSIYGMEEVKEAMALQLFSSPSVHHNDGTTTRGDIHILLVGDPGIAKSQLLKYIVGLSPRGIFTSGKGASGVGLTASAVRDEMLDGRWTIEAGALPMADMGIAAIDELDKMEDKDRDALHEGLEQQSISIAKAGITATLRCRCAVIAAANPKLGRFDRYEPVATQIKIMPTLLSRFDLIFVLYDIPETVQDTKIASHILMSDVDDSVCTPRIQPELLRKYIAYARKNVFPQMTEEAMKILQAYYLGVRAQYNTGANQPVPTTARQLQGLMRLSKAAARLRLSKTVEEEDAKKAVSLTDSCLKKVGVDPDTGKYDAGAVDTGVTKSVADKTLAIMDIIRDLSKDKGLAQFEDIINEAEEKGIDRSRAEKIIDRLKRGADLMEPRNGFFRLT